MGLPWLLAEAGELAMLPRCLGADGRSSHLSHRWGLMNRERGVRGRGQHSDGLLWDVAGPETHSS